MKLYKACIDLNIWQIAKARSEVWSILNPNNNNNVSLHDLKLIAKKNFKHLAMIYHPDKNGEDNKYIKIQQSLDIVNSATVSDFIDTLKDEVKDTRMRYMPGSNECQECSKWSDIACACITTSCTGFEPYKRRNVYNTYKDKRRRKTVQSNSFFSKRSKTVGQVTG